MRIDKFIAMLFFFTVWFFLCANCSALEWKSLHEKADSIDLKSAAEASSKDPSSLDALYVLALVCLDRHNDKEAEAYFTKMLELSPGLAEAEWGIAECLRRKHEMENSALILKRIIESNPRFYPAYISLGYIKFIERKFDDVVSLMNTVLRGSGNADLSTIVRAHCIYAGAKGMIADSGGPVSKVINGIPVMSHFKAAQRLQPDNVAVPYGLGCYFLLVPPQFGRDINKAEKYLKKALELDPLFADSYVRLAEVYSLRGDQLKAQEYLDTALKLDPKNELAADVVSGECFFICGWTNK